MSAQPQPQVPEPEHPPPEPGQPAKRRRVARLLQLAALAGVAGLLGVLVWDVVHRESGAKLVAAVRSGKAPAAPLFTLPILWTHDETWPASLRPAIADGEVALAELRGQPVVLNFWASWCVPCKEEAPRLAAGARNHAGRVAFLGIDVQDFKSDARAFLGRYKANYVSVRDGSDRTYSAYGLTGIPETYYLDRRGRIVAHAIGAVSEQELEQGITQIVRRSP